MRGEHWPSDLRCHAKVQDTGFTVLITFGGDRVKEDMFLMERVAPMGDIAVGKHPYREQKRETDEGQI